MYQKTYMHNKNIMFQNLSNRMSLHICSAGYYLYRKLHCAVKLAVKYNVGQQEMSI